MTVTVRKATSMADFNSLAQETGHPAAALSDCAVDFVVAQDKLGNYCGWWAYDQTGEMHTIRMVQPLLNLVKDGLRACGVVFEHTGTRAIVTSVATTRPADLGIRQCLTAAGFKMIGKRDTQRVYQLTKEDYDARSTIHSGSS